MQEPVLIPNGPAEASHRYEIGILYFKTGNKQS